VDKLHLDTSLEAGDNEMLIGILNQITKVIDSSPEAQAFTCNLLNLIADGWKAAR
jgi:hypothetical protein